MLTTEPTAEMVAEWKRIFADHRALLTPNRKSGAEVDRYFREKYTHKIFDSPEFGEIAAFNITENAHSRSKLPPGRLPEIKSYQTGGARVAIDLLTGEIHVESENTAEAAAIYDDLFVFRGLDEQDLTNFFLVAEYVKLSNAASCPQEGQI